jgi:hypothetical protein
VTAATIVVLVYGAFVLAASGWALWFTRPYVPPASALDEPAAHADSCPDCNGWLVAEMTVFNAACAGYWAWVLWSGRKRKDRKPSRVLGVVADLGHRLAVHPVPVRSE